MTGHITKRMGVLLIALTLALALGVAACGKKGAPEPPDKDSPFPRTYPAK